jgi:hypothetical protein
VGRTSAAFERSDQPPNQRMDARSSCLGTSRFRAFRRLCRVGSGTYSESNSLHG